MIGTVFGNKRSQGISRLIFIDPLPVHPFVERAAVVKNPVQNYLHPPLVGFLHQTDKDLIAGLQIFLPAHPADVAHRSPVVLVPRIQLSRLFTDNFPEMRIHVIVILAVVFMIGGRHKNRIHIDHLNSQILQIIQFVNNPLQVSAVKIPHVHILGRPVPVFHLRHMLADIAVLPCLHVIGGVSVAETVHVNLIHDRPFCPVRGMESGDNAERIHFLQIPGNPQFIVVAGQPSVLYFKKIKNFFRPCLHLGGIVVKSIDALLHLHFFADAAADKIHSVHIISPGSETDGHRISGFRFAG